MKFEQTWRWFGPEDPVTLSDIRQAGATGVVTALHHIPNGEVWSKEEIRKRIHEVKRGGLEWSVVESVPVHENIKKRAGDFQRQIDNYCQTIQNLGSCGIRTICYNFMPVLDWTRTDLEYMMDDGSDGLCFEMAALAAFDLFLLKRPGAEGSYTEKVADQAKELYDRLGDEERERLSHTILAGLPGSEERYSLDDFRKILLGYREIDEEKLRSHLYSFLEEIIPVAEEAEVQMAIHPDDPPFSLLGLPRIVSTEADASRLLEAVDSPSNGLTFCTGSYGVREDNDLPGMVERLGSHIHFVHLRNIQRTSPGSFYEADHLGGSVDMFAVMQALVREQKRRSNAGRIDLEIPIRPDHGHRMLDDRQRVTNPGYSGIGRLRGLAELRGLEMGIRRSIE